jgi:hypothetical protein
VTQTVSEWAARAATLPAALVEATPRAVVASARILDQQVTTNLRTATGGDLRLSRVRSGKGAQITTRVRTVGAGSRTRAQVVPGGPIMLVEEDTKRHRLPRQYLAARTDGARTYSMARRRSASRRGFLYIPGVGYRTNAQHPGTKGKRPVRKAFQASADEAGRAGSIVFRNAIRQHLAG